MTTAGKAFGVINALGAITFAYGFSIVLLEIQDTLHLAEVLVSEAFLPEIVGRSDLQQISEPEEMAFDADGNLRAVN